jgi:hypothetical protein
VISDRRARLFGKSMTQTAESAADINTQALSGALKGGCDGQGTKEVGREACSHGYRDPSGADVRVCGRMRNTGALTMFEADFFLVQGASNRRDHCGDEYRINQAARALFHQAQRIGRVGRWWAALRTRQESGRLLCLADFGAAHPIATTCRPRVETVNLSQIRGTVGRQHDFDARFHPLKSSLGHRWMRVATARHEERSLPPVALIQIEETYFVQDGHHRVSVARARGELDIEAEVTNWKIEA